MKRVIRHISKQRILRSGLAVAAMSALAACSTSSDRFGPFDGGQQTVASGQAAGSGYNNNVDNTYTAAIPRNTDIQSVPVSPSPVQRQPVRTANRGSVTVQHGDTLYSIARNNGVSVSQLSAANGIQPPYNISAGQVLRIPGQGYAASAARPAVASGASSVYVVKPGDTLYSISRRHGLKVDAVASHNGMGMPYTVKIGQPIRIPGGYVSAVNTTPSQPLTQTASISTTRASSAVPRPVTKPKAIASVPVRDAAVAKPVVKKKVAHKGPLPKPKARSASKFRWPVKGRIISKFGPKANGSKNDGINIAVPEGTSVKAAENGVVAYAGNELKGYGNLVLIRHADNWVTAYAHNKNLLVSRGQRVKRGQIIARAGRTGSVTSPQVHFEIRRGSTAVNPLRSLESSQVAGG